MSKNTDDKKFAIRFGLGAIKAVGYNMMEKIVEERQTSGDFKNIYEFAERLDPKLVNKKSLEALAKSGAFDPIHDNRCQIAESFGIISSYSAEKAKEANSNQMSLFGGLPEGDMRPDLKKVSNWDKQNRLQKEFEAFGFFLNEHPLDDKISALKKRGAVFSPKIEKDQFEDGSMVKMAGVVASSKHRSGARGRFAYLTISDPFGIYEVMVFDEALINSSRDILEDGSLICLDCLVRKDEGGIRILVKDLRRLEDFIASTKEAAEEFEDIKIKKMRAFNKNNNNQNSDNRPQGGWKKPESATPSFTPPAIVEINPDDIYKQLEVIIESRDSIFTLKAFLSQCKAAEEAPTFSQVSLYVGQKSPAKIALPGKYIFTDEKIAKLKKLPGIKAVEGDK